MLLLLLLSKLTLVTICTSSTQIRVNSSNYLIDAVKSLIIIHQSWSPWLHIQTTGRTRNAVGKSNFFFTWLLVWGLLNHTLMLASNTWAIILTFFVNLVDFWIAAVVFHLTQGRSLSFTLLCFWSKVFTTKRVFAQRCLV